MTQLQSISIVSSPVTVTSVPASCVPVPSTTVPSSVPSPASPTSVLAPVSCCSATSRDRDASMPPEPLVAGAPSSQPAVSSRPPRISSADNKKLNRLVVPKVKLGSDSSTVKKQCLALVKTHKLNMSPNECSCIALSVCSGEIPSSLPDVFPVDNVSQVRDTLDQELSKISAAEFINASVFTSKFLSTHSVPYRFRTTVYSHVRSFISRTRF